MTSYQTVAGVFGTRVSGDSFTRDYVTIFSGSGISFSWDTTTSTATLTNTSVGGSGNSLFFTSNISAQVTGSNVTLDLPRIITAGSGCSVSYDSTGRVTAAATSITTAAVTGTWTSGVSTSDAQGLGSTWTVSRISSAVSILANEVWSSGASVGSIITTSRLSSSATIIGNAIWSSGFSALGSIATVSRVSSNVSVLAAGVWTSGLSVGNATAGGSLIPAISSISSKIGPLIVQGSNTSFVVVTWAAAQPGDAISVTVFPDTAVSSLSSGIVLHSHCTKAGQVEMRWSNCSTLVQRQSAKTYYFVRITPF